MNKNIQWVNSQQLCRWQTRNNNVGQPPSFHSLNPINTLDSILLNPWLSLGLAASLEPLPHRRNVANLSLFHRYCLGRCSSELALLVPLPFSRGRSTRYSD